MSLPTNPSDSFKRLNPHLYPASGLPPSAQQERGGDPFDQAEDPRTPYYQGRCRLRLVSFRRRLLDGHWNFYSGHFIDALTELALIRGDSEIDIEVEQTQVKVSYAHQERTEIFIEPIEEKLLTQQDILA